MLRDARQAFVCFVPAGAEVTPDDVLGAVEYLGADAHVQAAAVGAGEPGRGEVTFFGLPWRRQRSRSRRAVLAPIGAATVLRRAALEGLGGYDEQLGAAAAELDVCWRLWLGGGTVVDLRPRARDGDDPGGDLGGDAEGDPGGEGADRDGGEAPDLASWVREGAAPEDPPRIDPGELVDAAKVAWRCLDESRAAAAIAGCRRLVPHLVEPAQHATVLGMLDEIASVEQDARSRVQRARRRADAQLLHLLGDPLVVPWVEGGALAVLADELSLPALFDRRRRVLVVTGDVVGPGMAGPAIRAWHMAECLADEHQVVLATTSGHCTGGGIGFDVEAPDATRFAALVDWCEIVVVQGFVLLHVPELARDDKTMVVDVYDLLHLEALELSKKMPDGSRAAHVDTSLHVLNEQATRGDFFICASEKQRDYWIGHLSALGRVNPATYGQDPLLRSLVDVVPFGLPPGAPERNGPGPRSSLPGIGPDDDVLLWAGGIYDWLDPSTLVRAVDRLRHLRPQVRLVFMGTRHPNPEVPVMAMAEQARQLARELGLEGTHVFFNEGWVDYGSRQNWLLDADVGVSTHFEHAETAFAFRTRLLDYLWAGLPVVATAGDAFADLIVREGLGRVVEPEDVDGLSEALYELLGEPAALASCRAGISRIRSSFEWPTTLEPLLRFCREPAPAPDRAERVAHAGPDAGGTPGAKGWHLGRRTRTAAALYAQGGMGALLRVVRERLGRTGG